MGSITNFNDRNELRRSATSAYQNGYIGASYIHLNQVDILNQCFTPSREAAEEAKQIIHLFELALAQGRVSLTYKNQMIDYPHYEQAQSRTIYVQIYCTYTNKGGDT